MRDAAVLNADDAQRHAVRSGAATGSTGSAARKRVASGAFLQDGQIVFRARRPGYRRCSPSRDIGLRGEHNVENVLAAASVAFLLGVEPAKSPPACAAFAGVEHRLEFVAEIGGVDFFNDSKATNVDAAHKAIEAFPGGLLVILGGKDKGSDFAPLAELLRQRARQVFLIGAAAEKIEAQLGGGRARRCRPERSIARVAAGIRTGAAGRHRASGAGLRQLRPI